MFGNDLPVSSLLLDAPTVRELAARLAGQAWQPLPAAEDEGPALPILVPAPEERYQPFHLTDIQQAYVVGRDEHFDLGGVACHSYTEHEGTRVDLDRLNAAWQRLIERHDMLRAVVLPDGRQQVLEHVPLYQIEVLDLRGRPPAELRPSWRGSASVCRIRCTIPSAGPCLKCGRRVSTATAAGCTSAWMP